MTNTRHTKHSAQHIADGYFKTLHQSLARYTTRISDADGCSVHTHASVADAIVFRCGLEHLYDMRRTGGERVTLTRITRDLTSPTANYYLTKTDGPTRAYAPTKPDAPDTPNAPNAPDSGTVYRVSIGEPNNAFINFKYPKDAERLVEALEVAGVSAETTTTSPFIQSTTI